VYGKKERSGGGKSVAEGKGRSRRFGAASPAGPGAAEQETYGPTGATTLRDAPSRVVSTGFGMIPRFVRPPSKKRLRPSSPVALESECDDVLRPSVRTPSSAVPGSEARLWRIIAASTRGAPSTAPAGGPDAVPRPDAPEHSGGGALAWEEARLATKTRPSTPGGAPGAAAPPSLERRRPSAMAPRTAPAPRRLGGKDPVRFRSGPGRAAGSAAPAGKAR